MLGLSVGTDSGVPKLGQNNRKSYNFASSNIGRFHTSGVSGSMKKHTAKKTKEQLGETEKGQLEDDQDEKLRKLKERSKNYVPERLEIRQREIEEDTMKLLALEKKLEEVKRQKELKRKREEARHQQRLQFSSARKIQRQVRSWLLKRYMRAATALQSFLKFAAAKQAVAAATWAIATLRDFVQMIEVKQQAYKTLKEAARNAAISTWINVEKGSAAGVVAARQQAVMIAAHSIKVGTHSAALQKQHKKRPVKKTITSPKAFGSPSARAAKMWALLRKRVVPVKFKFHDKSYRRRTVFTDGYLNPAKDIDHPHYHKKGNLSMVEVAVQVEENKKRTKMEEVMRLHKQREEAMAQEKILRLQMIEEEKKRKELEQSKHQQEEFIQKAQKEKSKIDFLRRVENQQIERAKVVNQVRERKEKIRREREALAKQEVENEAHENKLMYAEDIRFFQNLEKVRKQRLKEYAAKRKLELQKIEKDYQPGPSQVAAGPGYLSARGGGATQDDMSEHQMALEEERKMNVWAANDAAMKHRLAARRAAEKEEKRNAELEQEAIRKEKELVAMKAQLMLKRAAFMKAKAKKLKDQAHENSKNTHEHGGAEEHRGTQQGSTSARARSRCGSRSGGRKKASGRTGSGSAPTTARESPGKTKKPKVETIYDVDDPLALDTLLPNKPFEPPGEDWDWHTPRAVGSGKSAVSDLRRSKYSPILHKQMAGKNNGPLVSPGAVRLNSAERLAMACRRDQEQSDQAPHPYDQHNDEVILQSSPFKSPSAHELLSSRKNLPLSPIELEESVLKESLKLPSITHTASEGKINKKTNNIVSKGVLKNKYINEKLENSPYGSLLPKQHQQSKHSKQSHITPNCVERAVPDPYLTPQTLVAPTAAFTSMNRPIRPSLQGISITGSTNAGVKKSVKGESLMEIVEKAREKLRQDIAINSNKEETSAMLITATAALGGKSSCNDVENESESIPSANVKPKLKKKVKKAKKKAPQQVPVDKVMPVAPNKEKVTKRKLINETYNKIMKSELAKKNAEKKAVDTEVPPEVVADFFAKRRQTSDEAVVSSDGRQNDNEIGQANSSLSYWTSLMTEGGGSPPREKAATAISKKSEKSHPSSPEKSRHDSKPPHTNLRDSNVENQVGDGIPVQKFLLDDDHLQLNSSPYEDQQAQKEMEMIEQHLQLQQQQQQQQQQQNQEERQQVADEYDEYEDDYDDDFETHNKIGDQQLNVGTGFRESESYGDAYEEELNMECERLRAELEKKMLAKFDI